MLPGAHGSIGNARVCPHCKVYSVGMSLISLFELLITDTRACTVKDRMGLSTDSVSFPFWIRKRVRKTSDTVVRKLNG